MIPWMPGVERAETAARGGYGGVDPGRMRARAICLHVVEGWVSTMKMWAKERPAHHYASYHFVIGMDGHIVQFLPIGDQAWHAGRRDYVDASGRLVASDVPGARLVEPTWPLWDPSVNPGGETVAIAREGFSVNSWTPEQLDSAILIASWVMEEHGIIPSSETLIGHSELNPASRSRDPGGEWDKERMISLIGNNTQQPGILMPGEYALPDGASLTVE